MHRLPTPAFKVGDKVWLLRRYIKTTRPSDKLDFKRLGPFPIQSQVNPVAFKLKLPPSFRIHPVFHVSLLEPYHGDSSPDRRQPPPPPVEIDGVPEFEVKQILDSKVIRKRLFYLVDWEGYDPSERSWEPAEHLTHALDSIKTFHTKYPSKPKAPASRPRHKETQQGSSAAGTSALRRRTL